VQAVSAFLKKTIVRDTSSSGTAGEWMSFKEASSKDGEDVVREYIKTGTMKSKPNPRLGPDSSIEWPWNLVVAYEKQVWGTSNTVETAHEETGSSSEVAVAKAKATATASRELLMAGSSLRADSPVDTFGLREQPKNLGPNEATKTCIKHLRLVHSQWDRTRSEWKACLATSALNHNTRDSKIEMDLAKILASCDRDDEHMMQFDLKHRASKKDSLSDSDIVCAGEQATDLVNQIKAGGLKATALVAWFNA